LPVTKASLEALMPIYSSTTARILMARRLTPQQPEPYLMCLESLE
jgi:hypothetical protein